MDLQSHLAVLGIFGGQKNSRLAGGHVIPDTGPDSFQIVSRQSPDNFPSPGHIEQEFSIISLLIISATLALCHHSSSSIKPRRVCPTLAAMAVLTVGTDCTGIGIAILALTGLGIRCRHVFASDICPIARSVMSANAPAETVFANIYDRPLEAPVVVDLYIAGFPCQPFSMAGLRQGFAASNGNGLLFFRILAYIRQAKPKAFLLENVSGLMSLLGGTCFMIIWQALLSLGNYNIAFQEMNTKEHGVPQNRPRIFFVGVRKDIDRGSFRFPDPLASCPSIERFLDPRPRRPCFADLPPETSTIARDNVLSLLSSIGDQGHDPFNEPWVLDCDSSAGRAKGSCDISPCLTRSRAQGHWITNRGRRMKASEMLRLQGWFGGFVLNCSPLQLGQLLGNSMSVNVLQRIFCSLLPAIGWCDIAELPDPWASLVLRNS